ncbi:MAG: PASTA domain-containing protein [Bacteroidales bacterium]|nr:PASTA domain-containing protein [Bacteroidales bacterium]
MAKQTFIQFLQKYPVVKHLLLMLGVSLAILVVVFVLIKIYARQGQEYELHDIVGMNYESVRDNNELSLRYVVMDSIYKPGVEGGLILTQDPKPGTMIKKGRKIYITMTAYSAEDAVMPELSGSTVRQAVSHLESAGLQVGSLKFVDDPYKNAILGQSVGGKNVYAGQQIPRGSMVDLTVGLGDGKGESVVPFVIGKTSSRARRDILVLSLNVGREHYKGVKDKQNAVVYRQDPDYTGISKYPFGTSVELWYCDATNEEIDRMVKEFKVDSSKIILPAETEEGFFSDDDGYQW